MKIVSNESSQILKNLNDVKFDDGTGIDLRPSAHLHEIDELNKKVSFAVMVCWNWSVGSDLR